MFYCRDKTGICHLQHTRSTTPNSPKGWHSVRWKSNLMTGGNHWSQTVLHQSAATANGSREGTRTLFLPNEYFLLATSCHLRGLLHAMTLTQVFPLRQSTQMIALLVSGIPASRCICQHLNYFKSGILMVHVTCFSVVKADIFQQCPSG